MSVGAGILGSFHFLRPEWLWALLPVALVLFLLWRQGSAAERWRGLIAPHLLEHLVVRPRERSRLRPSTLLGPVLVLAVLAVAGPSWRREPPPFTQDTAPLILALDLSETMLVEDIQPSRLERAQQKARDLLAGRKGARTGLLAYAGSAHLVLPLTDDPSVLETYVSSLDPSVMPVPGKDSVAALDRASAMLADEPTPGTVLFLTDGVRADDAPAFREFTTSHRDQIAVLAIGTEQGGPIPKANGGFGEVSVLDRSGLEALEREAEAYVTTVTVDDTDVRRLNRQIASHLTAVQQEDAEGRWRDEGLVADVAARGGDADLVSQGMDGDVGVLGRLIDWVPAVGAGHCAGAGARSRSQHRPRRCEGAVALPYMLLLALAGCSGSELRFVDLWLTADQQGQRLFDQGQYAEAAQRFEDPLWKGTAYYYSQDFGSALAEFAKVDTAGGWFNRGNALAHLERYEEAREAYARVLELDPDYPGARANYDYLEPFLPLQFEGGEMGTIGRDAAADEIVFDANQDRLDQDGIDTVMEGDQQAVSDQQLAEIWLRQVDTSPTSFLRYKFAYQAVVDEEDGQ